jgi:hypothetical protein
MTIRSPVPGLSATTFWEGFTSIATLTVTLTSRSDQPYHPSTIQLGNGYRGAITGAAQVTPETARRIVINDDPNGCRISGLTDYFLKGQETSLSQGDFPLQAIFRQVLCSALVNGH